MLTMNIIQLRCHRVPILTIHTLPKQSHTNTHHIILLCPNFTLSYLTLPYLTLPHLTSPYLTLPYFDVSCYRRVDGSQDTCDGDR